MTRPRTRPAGVGWSLERLWSQRGHLRPLLPALPGLLALLLGAASYGMAPIIDDAYISITYAGHLADGDGLVFHPALPPTEGYSNLLWTLILALALAVGLPGAAAAAALGLLFSGAALVLVSLRIGGTRGAAAGLAVALSPIYGYWAGRGLETGLVTLLLVVAALNLGRGLSWAAFGLLGVARVEGVAWGALGLAHALLVERRLPRARELALWLGPFALQLLFRLLYYERLVPAPALAKTGRSLADDLAGGLGWLAGALVAQPLTVLALLVAMALIARDLARGRGLAGSAPWAAAVCLGLGLFSVVVGGDWMPNLRWLMPAVPLAWLALAEAAPGSRGYVPLALIAAVLGAQTGTIDKQGRVTARRWSDAGQVLRMGPPPTAIHPALLFVVENLGPDEAVVHPDVGLLAWVTGNPVLDPQGLCWADVALTLRHGWTEEPEGVAALARISETIRALRPGLVAIPIGRGLSPIGPIGAAVFQDSSKELEPWFAEGWEQWREADYNAGLTLRYYVRRDLAKPTKQARVRRYEAALARAPEAEALRTRLAWTLRQLDRDDEARAVEAGLDPRARRIAEIWSR